MNMSIGHDKDMDMNMNMKIGPDKDMDMDMYI
jgi:hypothetical protein